MELDVLADHLRRFTVEVRGDDGAMGAGVVWAPGVVVTAAHVIRRARVAIRTAEDRQSEGVVVAHDRDADLAVLRLSDRSFAAMLPATCERVRVGSLIVAMGHPFGVRGAVTKGIVHAVGPVARGGRSWIQTDLRLAPGNSGGPLADARGQLVGLNTMIVQGLGFAIPVSEVKEFVRAAGVPA